jgi:hypothetical protein
MLKDTLNGLRLFDIEPQLVSEPLPPSFDRRIRTLHAATSAVCGTNYKTWFVSPSARLVAAYWYTPQHVCDLSYLTRQPPERKAFEPCP